MLRAVPIELGEANAFVDALHRHHGPVVRDKFRVGVEKDGKLVGVAQVGRPVARRLCDGRTLEVVRCCTDGTKNACTFLYSRCARIAEEMVYSRIITYILESESGISLKASGWRLDLESCGGGHGTFLRGEGRRSPQTSSGRGSNTPPRGSRDGSRNWEVDDVQG